MIHLRPAKGKELRTVRGQKGVRLVGGVSALAVFVTQLARAASAPGCSNAQTDRVSRWPGNRFLARPVRPGLSALAIPSSMVWISTRDFHSEESCANTRFCCGIHDGRAHHAVALQLFGERALERLPHLEVGGNFGGVRDCVAERTAAILDGKSQLVPVADEPASQPRLAAGHPR